VDLRFITEATASPNKPEYIIAGWKNTYNPKKISIGLVIPISKGRTLR
jgi:hypothetical protein